MARTKIRRKKKGVPKLATEKQVHKAICNYIRMVYPDTIFFSDASGVKLSIGAATDLKATRSSSSIPDLFVAKPSGEFHGLFIEIKASKLDAFKVDGKLRETEHIIDQAKMLDRLHHLGYHAVFGCGLNECQKIVDWYFSLSNTKKPSADQLGLFSDRPAD